MSLRTASNLEDQGVYTDHLWKISGFSALANSGEKYELIRVFTFISLRPYHYSQKLITPIYIAV